MDAVQKNILGDGSDDNPYYIDGTVDVMFEVVSMDWTAKTASIRIF